MAEQIGEIGQPLASCSNLLLGGGLADALALAASSCQLQFSQTIASCSLMTQLDQTTSSANDELQIFSPEMRSWYRVNNQLAELTQNPSRPNGCKLSRSNHISSAELEN